MVSSPPTRNDLSESKLACEKSLKYGDFSPKKTSQEHECNVLELSNIISVKCESCQKRCNVKYECKVISRLALLEKDII